MMYRINYVDKYEHTEILYDSHSLDSATIKYNELLSSWQHSDTDDYLELEEYDDDEFHFDTILEHTF